MKEIASKLIGTHFQVALTGSTRSAPPSSSQIAFQATGAKVCTSSCLWSAADRQCSHTEKSEETDGAY